MTPLLDVRGLHVAFPTSEGAVRVVDDVSLSLDAGEVLAIVGESGSGKTVTALTLMGLVAGARVSGSALLGGVELVGARPEELRRVRGEEIAMVFQDPMTSLNPVQRVGRQIAEQIRAHRSVSAGAARAEAVSLLGRVGMPQPGERVDAFPHELSGGMRQRAMLAMALSCSPAVLIADEPTTALDVTVQAQILALLDELRSRSGVGIVLVTHDLGVVADLADRIAVMYAGQIVEQGTVEQVFYDPQHPYTWGLLGSITRVDRPRPARLPSIGGAPPSLVAPPEGCHFRPRCPHEVEACARVPALAGRGGADGHLDRCVLDSSAKERLRMVGRGQIGLGAPP